MRVVFRDPETEEIMRLRAPGPAYPPEVIRQCNRKLIVLEAAPDERTLRNWKSLHYEKLQGDRRGQRSIRINDQWRLVFTLNERTSLPTIEVISVEDYH